MYELNFTEEKPLRVIGCNSVRYDVRHFLRAPSAQDWANYEAALSITNEESERGSAFVFDRLSACAALWDRICSKVEGYQALGPDGTTPKDLMEFKDWRARVSIKHKEAAVLPLVLVRAVPPESQESSAAAYVCGATIPVSLRAGVDDTVLQHFFAEPGPTQEVRASRLSETRWYQPATKDTPARTVIPPTLVEWVALYDELIRDVSGYTFGNRPLTGRERGVEQIRRAMDAWHKQAAVIALFHSPDTVFAAPSETKSETKSEVSDAKGSDEPAQ